MFENKGELISIIDDYYITGKAPDIWYDWFCTQKSLPKRGLRLMQILTFFVKHKKVDLKGKYAFFKNNAPTSGGTYDQVSICDVTTGNVLFCIQERKTGIEVYSADDDFETFVGLPI